MSKVILLGKDAMISVMVQNFIKKSGEMKLDEAKKPCKTRLNEI